LLTRATGTNGAALSGDINGISINDFGIAGGKLALTNSTTVLTNSGTGAPTVTSAIVDFVGWGTANYREGATAAPAMANATSIKRINNGCTDSNSNSADFPTPLTAPTARTTATAQNLSCANDANAPTVQTASIGNAFVVGTSFNSVSFTFDQPMVTVPAGNLTVNGSPATSVTGSWRGPYVFSGFATPADGAVTVTLAATGLADTQTQTLAADYTLTGTYVGTQPGVTLSTPDVSNGGTESGAINFTAEFTEDVTGFTSSDLTLLNGTVSAFAAVDGNTYTFTMTPGHGPTSVGVAASVATATTAPNNPNTAATTYAWTNDIIGPRRTANTAVPSATNSPVGVVSVTFNEPVYDLSLADISLSKDFVSQSLVGLTLNWSPGDTTVSFDLSSFNTVDGTYGLIVGQTGTGSTARDVWGNKVNQPAVISWILDRTAPAPTMVGAVDNTVIGTTATLTITGTGHVNGVGLGNTPVGSAILEVKAPGQSSFGPSGRTPFANVFSLTFATGGRYEYRYAVTDTASNTGYSAPFVYETNPTANASLTQTITSATETLVFPMTGSQDVTIALTGATPSGTITVQRVVGPIVSPGTGLTDPAKLINEYLAISSSGAGTFTASLTWQYDPANVGSLAIDRAFRVSGGALAGTFNVTPVSNSATVNGISAFSEWYLGEAAADVSDWTLLAD